MPTSSFHPTRPGGLLALGLCLAACVPAWATGGAERYEGLAHARISGRLLYQETHWRYQEGGAWQHLVLYSCPDGTPFARKLLRELPGAEQPDFDFQDARDGYREGVRTQGAAREVYVQPDGKSPPESRPLAIPPGAVIDAGFDAFVRNRWAALSQGESVKVPFLIPSRHDYLDFKIADARDGLVDGRPVRRLRMKLAAWYGFVAPAIELAYERDGSRLVEFQGIGTLRDARGRQLDVRIVFPAARRGESPSAAEIAQAATRPLSNRYCAGESP